MKRLLIGLILASLSLIWLGMWLLESATTPVPALTGLLIAVIGFANLVVNAWNLFWEWRWL